MSATTLISFDIDGTLEVGAPPGAITLDLVRCAKALGYLVGSCSDRPLSAQQRMWSDHGITVDFTVLKQQLETVKELFPAQDYYHVGDTDIDRYYAEKAGFHFLLPDGDALRKLVSGEGP